VGGFRFDLRFPGYYWYIQCSCRVRCLHEFYLRKPVLVRRRQHTTATLCHERRGIHCGVPLDSALALSAHGALPSCIKPGRGKKDQGKRQGTPCRLSQHRRAPLVTAPFKIPEPFHHNTTLTQPVAEISDLRHKSFQWISSLFILPMRVRVAHTSRVWRCMRSRATHVTAPTASTAARSKSPRPS
jgi:hypothetical protein